MNTLKQIVTGVNVATASAGKGKLQSKHIPSDGMTSAPLHACVEDKYGTVIVSTTSLIEEIIVTLDKAARIDESWNAQLEEDVDILFGAHVVGVPNSSEWCGVVDGGIPLCMRVE